MKLFQKSLSGITTKKPETLRVVTFNVHFARRPLEIVRAIRSNAHLRDADIFLLQEIEFHEREVISRAEAMASALGLNYVYAPARPLRTRGSHGLAILSRVQLEDVQIISLPFYRLMLRSRPRIALLGKLRLGGTSIQICNAHLDTTLSIENRIAQMDGILKAIRQSSARRIIIGGDFNTLPFLFVGNRSVPVFFSNQRRRFDAHMRKMGFTTTERMGYTLRRGIVGFQLDGIYTKQLRILRSGVERQIAVSDHKPVWADIKV